MSDPISELFASMDKDGDGLLTLGDLEQVMPEASMKQLQDIIDKLNGNDVSGAVTFEQFEAGFDMFSGAHGDESSDEEEEETTGESGSIKQLFNSLDSDGDGCLIVSDLRSILPDVSAKDIQIAFDRLDTDKNAKVTFSEFLNGFEFLLQFGRDHSDVGVLDESNDSASAAGSRNRSATILDIAEESTFSEMKEHLESNPVLSRKVEEDERRRVMKTKSSEKLSNVDENGLEDEVLDSSNSTDVQQLHEVIRKLTARAETYQRRYGLLAKVGRQLEDENMDLTNRLNDTESNLRYTRDELENVKDSLSEYRKMVTIQQEKEVDLSSRVRRTERTYEETMRQLELEQEQRKLLEDEMTEMKEELASLKQTRSTDLRSRIRSRLEEVNQLANKRRELGKSQMERKVQELTQENDGLKDRIHVLERELDSMKSLIADLNKEIERLRSMLGGQGVSLSEQLQEDEKAKKKKSKARNLLKQLNQKGTIKKKPTGTATLSRQRSATTAIRPEFLNPQKQAPVKNDKAAQEFFKQFQKQRKKTEESASKQLEKTKALLNKQNEKNKELERRVQELEEQMMVQKEVQAKQVERVKLTTAQQAELTAYGMFLNGVLSGDKELSSYLPVNTTNSDLLYKLQDGWILAKFLNVTQAHTIDERALNQIKHGVEEDRELKMENMTLVVESVRSLGAHISSDFDCAGVVDSHQNIDTTIRFVFEVISTHLLQHVNVKDHPELVRLLRDNEDVSDLLKTSPQDVLLKWVNFHLADASQHVVSLVNAKQISISKFTNEPRILDSSAFAILLHRIFPTHCPESTVSAIMSENDLSKRVQMIGETSEKCGMSRFRQFLSSAICSSGSEASGRLCLAYTASLFNLRTGVELLTMEEIDRADLAIMEDDVGDSREERAFRLWINSMGLQEGNDKVHIHNLFSECRDGLLLLRVMDRIQHGCVDWKKIEMKPRNKFQKLTNCNEVIRIGKDKLRFSLVNIGGEDLVDGNKKLTLSVVWQLMHCHITGFLSEVYSKKFGSTPVKGVQRRTSLVGGVLKTEGDADSMIIEWANTRVVDQNEELKMRAAQLLGTAFDYPFELMKSFHDARMSDSLYFMHLIWSVAPRIVNWDLVTKGVASEDKILNARYAISCARKLGATIFLLPEDIVEVKPKMITSFISSILSLDSFNRTSS